jgi:AcrR family transcriptional regulator
MPTLEKKRLQPRKQPAQNRSAVTVAAILEAAAHILERDGHGQYSTNAIAKRAGVSIGSLYQYFPGKDAITISLIHEHSRGITSAIEKAALIQDWQKAIRSMIDAAARHQLTRPTLARILDLEEARLQTENGAMEIATTVEAVLRRGLGETTSIDHRTVALDILAIARGVTDITAEQKKFSLDSLLKRLDCAVFGYISMACPGSVVGQ